MLYNDALGRARPTVKVDACAIVTDLERRLCAFACTHARHVDADDELPNDWYAHEVRVHVFGGVCSVLQPGPHALSIGLIGTAAKRARTTTGVVYWPRVLGLFSKFHQTTGENYAQLANGRNASLLPLVSIYDVRRWHDDLLLVAPTQAMRIAERVGFATLEYTPTLVVEAMRLDAAFARRISLGAS